MNTYAIHHDLFIQATAASIFQAISQPERLTQWWPLRCEGEPREGATYNFHFAPEYDWYAEVLKCVPEQHFHLKMTQADEDWNPTSFGFDLVAVDGGVQVSFWHRGWPACNHHFRRSSYCWAILLKGLKDYVEKGTVVPFEERE